MVVDVMTSSWCAARPRAWGAAWVVAKPSVTAVMVFIMGFGVSGCGVMPTHSSSSPPPTMTRTHAHAHTCTHTLTQVRDEVEQNRFAVQPFQLVGGQGPVPRAPAPSAQAEEGLGAGASHFFGQVCVRERERERERGCRPHTKGVRSCCWGMCPRLTLGNLRLNDHVI